MSDEPVERGEGQMEEYGYYLCPECHGDHHYLDMVGDICKWCYAEHGGEGGGG